MYKLVFTFYCIVYFSLSKVGNFSPHLSVPTAANMSKLMTWVMDGGRSSPADCLPRHHVALIIPFRDREQHLRIFLHNMHPFLWRQQLNYGIYVIEQVFTVKY